MAATPALEPVLKEKDRAVEIYAKATIADEARTLLEEFNFRPADFGLEASAATLGKGNTVNPTDDWEVFVPGKIKPRVWNIDREEVTPFGRLPKTSQEFPTYDARYKTVEYEHCIVTIVAKPYLLRQKDSKDTEPTDVKTGEYYRDYAQSKIGLLIERKENFDGIDIPAVYVRVSKTRDLEGAPSKTLKHDIIVYAKNSETNKSVRYVWFSGFPKPVPQPDSTAKTSAPAELKPADPSNGFKARMQRLIPFRTVMPEQSKNVVLPTYHPTEIPLDGTLAIGMESSVFSYLRRYAESPFEGTKHLAQFIIQNEPLRDFDNEQEKKTIQDGLKLLAVRGAGGTEPLDVGEVRVAMEQISSDDDRNRIDMVESSKLFLGMIEQLGFRKIYRDFLMKDPYGKIADRLKLDQILSFGVGVTKGIYAEQWAIFERFRSGFQGYREHLNRRLTVGAISRQVRTTDEYQTRDVSALCEVLESPNLNSPIRSIQFAEEERLGKAVRIIAVKVDFPGKFRGVMTLILGSDDKKYENFHVEELYKDYFEAEETYRVLGISHRDDRRLTYEIEKIPDFMKTMLPHLYNGYTYENMRPRALKAIKLLDSGKNTKDLSETIFD